MSTMRLNRYLALCGLGSRRAVERLILDGEISVNGRVVTDLATQVDPDRDRIEYRGRISRPATRHTYLALNKPRGYDVTRSDRHSRRLVYDLLPDGTHPAVKAVGRLDRDSTGLLLLTDDGELAHRLTHPSFGCPKTYDVIVDGVVRVEDLNLLTSGIHLDDGPAKAVSAQLLDQTQTASRLKIVMIEGRKRIVRRMCEAIGHPVRELERTAIGPIQLGNLRRGTTRSLTPHELRKLRHCVGL